MKPLSIGICAVDPIVASACREALGSLGELTTVARDRRALARPLPLDLLVLDLDKGGEDDIRLFATCMAANLELPIVLTCPDPGADTAVELLQLGAADFICAPPTPDKLRRKVRRLLTGKLTAAIDDPALEPLVEGVENADRRASYRAHVATDMDASVSLSLDGNSVRAAVMDLSLDGDRSPGALRVRTSAEVTAPKLWLLAGRSEHAGELHIEDDYDEPVSVRLLATRVRYSLRKRRMDVVLQYRTDDEAGSRRIGRFWIRCQRRDLGRVEYPPAG